MSKTLKTLLIGVDATDFRIIQKTLPADISVTRISRFSDGEGPLVTEDFDLLLLNLRQNNQLSEILQIRRQHPDKPLVIIVARNKPELGILSIRAGADCYLVKPVSGVRLQHAINCAIEHMRVKRDLEKTGRAFKVISKCYQALAQAKEEKEFLREICRIIVEEGGYRLAWIGFAKQDIRKTVQPIAWFGYEDSYLDKIRITWGDKETGKGPTGTAIREKKTCIIKNILTEPHYKPWRNAAVKHDYVSSIALPLAIDGNVIGALNIYSQRTDSFDKTEVELLENLASSLSFGIKVLRSNVEREHVKDALQQSETRYRTLVEKSADAILIVDKRGIIRFANKSAGILFGKKPEDLIGEDFGFPVVSEEVIEVGVPHKKEKKITEMQVVETIWNNEPAYHLSLRDITTLKKAERELHRAYEEILFIKNFNEEIVEKSPLGILRLDKDMRLIYENAAAKRIMGVPEGEESKAMGMDIRRVPSLVSIGIAEEFERLLNGEEIFIETPFKSIYGKETFLKLRGVPLYRNKRFNGAILLIEDITEKKRAEENLLLAYNELKSLGKVKDDIIANVSHELRTPITIAKGTIELAMEEENRELRNKLLAKALDALRKQDLIVEDLVEAGRKHKSRTHLVYTAINLTKVVRRAISELELEAKRKEISIKVNVPAEAEIAADEDKIVQVLRNLINNAIKFNRKGGVVRITAMKKEREIEICVEDTGPGVPEKYHKKIFEPLFQIDATSTRRYGGTGMGLAVAKDIIEAHKGKIWIESEVGKGTKFTFSLPL